jgi:threonine aldolase
MKIKLNKDESQFKSYFDEVLLTKLENYFWYFKSIIFFKNKLKNQ